MAEPAPASMRPGDFSPGNRPPRLTPPRRERAGGFNEAGGFLPRKPSRTTAAKTRHERASMRPGDFSPGNRLGAPHEAAGHQLLQ